MWKDADDVRAGDCLLGCDGMFVSIDSIERIYNQVDPNNKMSLRELHEIFHFSKRIARLENGKLLKRGK